LVLTLAACAAASPKKKTPKKRGSYNGTRRTYRAAAHADGFFWGGVTKKKIRDGRVVRYYYCKGPGQTGEPYRASKVVDDDTKAEAAVMGHAPVCSFGQSSSPQASSMEAANRLEMEKLINGRATPGEALDQQALLLAQSDVDLAPTYNLVSQRTFQKRMSSKAKGAKLRAQSNSDITDSQLTRLLSIAQLVALQVVPSELLSFVAHQAIPLLVKYGHTRAIDATFCRSDKWRC
jgi:hypothetical protein